MRRRTYLPYRQGLLLFGCIGLGSRCYGAVHGLTRGSTTRHRGRLLKVMIRDPGHHSNISLGRRASPSWLLLLDLGCCLSLLSL
ncbi:hypothetical protein ABZP36_016547 [Zizania latifolia]